jgi:KamA family protein
MRRHLSKVPTDHVQISCRTDRSVAPRLGVMDRYRPLTARTVVELPRVAALPADQRAAIDVVSRVLPFRVNRYVVDELIDWSRVPDDPMFRLTFPQREMLADDDYAALSALVSRDAPASQIDVMARRIRARLNPHPAGQVELNVPRLDGRPVRGLQHKYAETVLFFPSQGQTCHAYCTYCFRWPQFVDANTERFAAEEVAGLIAYLRAHPEVTSVLITGGDPLIMKTAALRRIIEPILRAELPSLVSIRIGSKSLAWWPQRFVSDDDADDLLRLFEEVVGSGLTLAFMAHVSHPRELSTAIAQQAIARIRGTGAVIRTQAPLIRGVNDDAATWATMWSKQVRLGMVPYYMFVERDTGPRNFFEVPLARAWAIYREAWSHVSGLARTARGPSMSATPGKVVVDGVTEIKGEKVFVLRFLQGRDPAWVDRPFFARFDAQATWLDQLKPPSWEERFFFEPAMERLRRERSRLAVLDTAA